MVPLTFYIRPSWNAAIAVAQYLESNQNLVKDKYILELGAGGGLPGIVSAQIGAAKVSYSLPQFGGVRLNRLRTKLCRSF